jgi:hypothetical protein
MNKKKIWIVACAVFPTHLLLSTAMMFVSYHLHVASQAKEPTVLNWIAQRAFEVLIFPGWITLNILASTCGDIGKWAFAATLLPSSLVWTGLIVLVVWIRARKGAANQRFQPIGGPGPPQAEA